jgi:hypothetical protein
MVLVVIKQVVNKLVVIMFIFPIWRVHFFGGLDNDGPDEEE